MHKISIQLLRGGLQLGFCNFTLHSIKSCKACSFTFVSVLRSFLISDLVCKLVPGVLVSLMRIKFSKTFVLLMNNSMRNAFFGDLNRGVMVVTSQTHPSTHLYASFIV
ncbi:hypothetical protein PIB30_009495 [Stylosanthes scabra]|uniref:Uncharacterized protein n=1 Tax=Stylosanthes scabra TaxID=79078 RepID=A0ABU6Y2D0_9FABA|nr:hypothetical protein [Stylosanthes scabra]